MFVERHVDAERGEARRDVCADERELAPGRKLAGRDQLDHAGDAAASRDRARADHTAGRECEGLLRIPPARNDRIASAAILSSPIHNAGCPRSNPINATAITPCTFQLRQRGIGDRRKRRLLSDPRHVSARRRAERVRHERSASRAIAVCRSSRSRNRMYGLVPTLPSSARRGRRSAPDARITITRCAQ